MRFISYFLLFYFFLEYVNTVEPRFNEMPRDWENYSTLYLNITNLQKNNQNVRYIEV